MPKALQDLAEPVERALAQLRAWVEHPFHVIKNLFRHTGKWRYRGRPTTYRAAAHPVAIVKKTCSHHRRFDDRERPEPRGQCEQNHMTVNFC